MKARAFVMTLRDHFTDKAEGTPPPTSDNNTAVDRDADAWARQYVDIKYLQPIMDAIDDDGSGHVTIAEVNRFTELLPKELGWRLAVVFTSRPFGRAQGCLHSLTLWLAYWAIGEHAVIPWLIGANACNVAGWQTFQVKYCLEVVQTYARMFQFRDKILPMNRNEADKYLRVTWPIASEFFKSFGAPAVKIPDYVEEKFKEYVQYEEDRIRKNLAGIKYDIDALETVYGIVGPGRVEKVPQMTMPWTRS